MSPDNKIWFVVIQPTPFCNIDCRYCYLPDRTDKSTMSPETIERVFSAIFESGRVSDRLTVIWHAGEPLILSPDYYKKAFDIVERLAPSGVRLRHSINTNAMFVNDAWCDLFKARRVNLGVSIDGPRDLHDASRVKRSGEGTFDSVLAGLRKLRQNEVDFYVITVLTRAALHRAPDLFAFYVEEGVRFVCFNIEEQMGAHDSTSVEPGDEQAYDRFLREFWSLTAAAGHPFAVREFENLLREVTWRPGVTRPRVLVEPCGHLNVNVRGDVSTYSPELMGLRNARYHDFKIGNLTRQSLEECLASEALLAQQRDIEEGVRLCQQSCEYFEVCGGGAPANKFSEHGTFAVAETRYCRFAKKVVADVVLDLIESSAIAERADAEDLPF